MPMMTPNEKLAHAISCHLSAIEHSANVNPKNEKGLVQFFGARAYAAGPRIHITYVSYQGATSLTAEEAKTYLAWLDAGWVGSHHQMERGGGQKIEVKSFVEPANDPTLYRDNGIHGRQYIHPSWGNIQVSRVSGMATLFGSNLEHKHYITLRIGSSYKNIGTSGDETISPHGNEIVEVCMSEAQWASLLSSLNMGSGIPCTLRRVGGEQMPECPADQVRERFHKVIGDDVKAMSDRLVALEEMVSRRFEDPKPLTKTEKKEFLGEIAGTLQELRSNMPYVQKIFEEKLEEQVEAAKTEIDGFIAFKAQMLGTEALKEKFASLASGLVEVKALPTGNEKE